MMNHEAKANRRFEAAVQVRIPSYRFAPQPQLTDG
jgi:hypothetical protein